MSDPGCIEGDEVEASRQVVERLLDSLARSVEVDGEGAPAARRLRRSIRSWHRGGEIVGIGVGAKHVEGLATGDAAVQIFVRRKRPCSQLHPSERIPAAIEIADLERSVLLDVEEMAPFEPAALTREHRPVFPGLSVAHCLTAETGSIGAVVRALGDPVNRYLLSAAHVIAAAGRARAGDAIIQPGSFDGGSCPRKTVATLATFTRFHRGANFPNRADAALAQLAPGIATTLGARPARRLAAQAEVNPHQVLFRTGCRTGERPVQIRSVSFATSIPHATSTGLPFLFGFRSQLLYTDYSIKGDSGGPVLTAGGALAGIHIAKNGDGFGIATPVWSLPPEWGLQLGEQ